MAAHRYWRLVGLTLPAAGPLELSEARLYASGALADTSATLACAIAPTSGALALLCDGLATGVVAWAAPGPTLAGFALTWDLGSAASVDRVQLGSGSSAAAFPVAFTLQWSDTDAGAGAVWTTYDAIADVQYPGAASMTAAAPVIIDSALLHFEGADASTAIMDATGKTWTAANGAALSTAWSKIGGSSLSLGASKIISTPSHADFDFGAGDFTIGFYLYLRSNSGADYTSILCKDNINVARGWLIITGVAGDGGAGIFGFTCFVGATVYAVADPVRVPAGITIHYAIVRDNGVLRLYRNGVQVASLAITGSINAPSIPVYMGALVISGAPSAAKSPDGYIDELQITKTARYPSGTDFTPPTLPATDYSQALTLTETSPLRRTRAMAPVPLDCTGTLWPAGAARSHGRGCTFWDVYHGGLGIIYGSVEAQHSPTNMPLRRRVLLIDEASRLTIRETWSDAVTGAYEFRGIREGVTYSVLSYDHTHALGAVVGDNITPEVML